MYVLLTLLKSSLYNFIEDVNFSKNKSWYQLSVQTWRDNFILWLFFSLIASIYCYVHGLIMQDPLTSISQSVLWATTRWLLFGSVFPLLIACLVNIEHKFIQNSKIAISSIALFLFTLLLVITLSAFISTSLGIIPLESQRILSLIYRDFPVKLTFLLISIVTYKKLLSSSIPKAAQVQSQPEKIINEVTSIWVMDGQKKCQLKISEICWVKTCGNYLEIHTQDDNKNYLLRKTLKSFKTELLESQFVQIHRSMMVNKNRITTLSNKTTGEAIMTLDNQVELTVSKTYRPQLTLAS